jgi:hypothetical protein
LSCIPMHKRPLLLLVIGIILLSSCYRSAYYFSPLNANSNGYKTIPMQSDSLKSASYSGADVRLGGSNFGWRDFVYSFSASFHRSHNWKELQVFYGANVSAGGYYVSPYHARTNEPYIDTTYINKHAGNKTFYSGGLQAGINYVIPVGSHGSEWRVIGIEASVQKEMGDYLNFRKGLTDSTARIVTRTRLFTNIGLTTEMVKRRRRYSLGVRFAMGIALPNYNNTFTGNTSLPVYFSPTFHFTRNRITSFGQLNITHAYASSLQLGAQYRLGRK